jgi:F0F1-type ATP synthase membrane subunit b/b'
MKAMTELKNEIADISIQMAEKIIKSELKDGKSQKKLIEADLKNHMN